MKFSVVHKDCEWDKNEEAMERIPVEIKATDKKNNDDKDRGAPMIPNFAHSSRWFVALKHRLNNGDKYEN